MDITGTITSNNVPLVGATCEYTPPNATTSLITETDGNGAFEFDNVQLNGTLTVEQLGYLPYTTTITSVPVNLNIPLKSQYGIAAFELALQEVKPQEVKPQVYIPPVSYSATTVTSSVPTLNVSNTSSTNNIGGISGTVNNTVGTQNLANVFTSGWFWLIIILLIVFVYLSIQNK